LLTCDLSDVQKLKIELLKNFLYSPIQKKGNDTSQEGSGDRHGDQHVSFVVGGIAWKRV
jgi:hypothetical protein